MLFYFSGQRKENEVDAATLLNDLKSFPSKAHVKETCRPGQGESTCRYLTMGPNGWSCEKASSLRRVFDERVMQGQMRARGDNCGGLLDIILQHQAELSGKAVIYEESMLSYHARGILRELKIDNEALHIVVMWESGLNEGKETSVILAEKALSIVMTTEGVTFGIAGLGSFAGQITIVLC